MKSFVPDEPKPYAMIDALVLRHGVLLIGIAYLRAALARRHPAHAGSDYGLSDHLRRDIGLGPRHDGYRLG